MEAVLLWRDVILVTFSTKDIRGNKKKNINDIPFFAFTRYNVYVLFSVINVCTTSV